MPSFDLSGKAAVVTGASQGIGRGVALALAEHGANVAVVARAPEAVTAGSERIHRPVEPVVREIEAMGREAVGILADVREPDQAQRVVKQTLAAFGRLDVLVNNAGATWGETFKMAPLLDLSPSDFHECLRLNLASVFLCGRAAAPAMLERGGGAIVNLASISGQGPSPGNGAYGAAKAGVISLTRTMAAEWAPVRVNAVAPGSVEHPDRAAVHPYAQGRAPVEQTTAVRRAGTVGDVAAAVLYLASDEASYVTGAVLDVNGGRVPG